MTNVRPSIIEAENAVKLLLSYIGENPNREGLQKTPSRVIKSYAELFSGYDMDIESIFEAKFYDVANFQDMVLLKNIKFNSICEHHILPIKGSVDICYLPDKCIIGISKLARVVECFARRLQVQERMTMEIAKAIQENLKPLGVAIRVSANHSCMSMRGVMSDSLMDTFYYTGVFQSDIKLQSRFIKSI
jgi:GTP cyclohydrolase I